ncbi:hypothetical protein GQ457_12G016890 [Hibiscus cannabinus]
MDDTLVQDLIEINEVEEDCEFANEDAIEAKKYLKKEDGVHAAPVEIREWCKAMILISKKEEKWIISRYSDEHNHVLASPKSTQFIRSHRVKTKVQKDLMNVLDESGICPSKIVSVISHECGGLRNLNMNERDVFNYLSRKRQKQMEKGDAQIMLDYFQRLSIKEFRFFLCYSN